MVAGGVYTSWNALAASAYIAAANALGEVAPRRRAVAIMDSIAERAWDGSALAHVAGATPEIRGLLTDDVAVITAILDEYETGHRPGALPAAASFAMKMRERLEDPHARRVSGAPQPGAPGPPPRRPKPAQAAPAPPAPPVPPPP